MNLERKLELLNAVCGEINFPADRIYREGGKLIATNGFQLLAFDMVEAETLDYPTLEEGAKKAALQSRKKSADLIRNWMGREEVNGAEVDSMVLHEFLRRNDYLKCPYCKGCGQRPADEPDMDFSGIVDKFDGLRPVLIFGHPFNGNMLVSTLAYLPMGETVSMSTWVEEKDHHLATPILRLAGHGWTLIQAALTQSEAAGADVFETGIAAELSTSQKN